MAAANHGDAPAYGDDAWTSTFERQIKEAFGPQAEGLRRPQRRRRQHGRPALMLGRYDAIICADTAHIATHETGAAERLLGVKLITVPTPDGKLRPADITAPRRTSWAATTSRSPASVSISQVTELGTCYTPAEIAELAGSGPRGGHAPPHGRRQTRQRRGPPGLRPGRHHHSGRRGRLQLRRNQERRSGGRGRSRPGPIPTPVHPLPPPPVPPTGLQDALHLSPALRSPDRRPVAPERRPRQRHGHPPGGRPSRRSPASPSPTQSNPTPYSPPCPPT